MSKCLLNENFTNACFVAPHLIINVFPPISTPQLNEGLNI